MENHYELVFYRHNSLVCVICIHQVDIAAGWGSLQLCKTWCIKVGFPYFISNMCSFSTTERISMNFELNQKNHSLFLSIMGFRIRINMCYELTFLHDLKISQTVLLVYHEWRMTQRDAFSLILYIGGVAQDCSSSIASALELLQFCVEPSIWQCNVNRTVNSGSTVNEGEWDCCHITLACDTRGQIRYYDGMNTLRLSWNWFNLCTSIFNL